MSNDKTEMIPQPYPLWMTEVTDELRTSDQTVEEKAAELSRHTYRVVGWLSVPESDSEDPHLVPVTVGLNHHPSRAFPHFNGGDEGEIYFYAESRLKAVQDGLRSLYGTELSPAVVLASQRYR